jgi:enoyl-CoA hydratase/carnithine racemase
VGDFVHVSVDDGVATILLDRPKVNALNRSMQAEIRQAALDVSTDDSVASVVLYGGPRVFAAGADIKELIDISHHDMVAWSRELQDCFTSVALIPKPTVAAINGFALGAGCELALCADQRFSAEDSKFGLPEILLGLIPGAGGTQRLARVIGASRAKDLIFSGRQVGAREALELGLVDKLYRADEVYPRAVAWASQFVGGPALALRAAKESLDQGLATDLATGLQLERMQFAALFSTQDRERGMRSFVENGAGKAIFTGH